MILFKSKMYHHIKGKGSVTWLKGRITQALYWGKSKLKDALTLQRKMAPLVNLWLSSLPFFNFEYLLYNWMKRHGENDYKVEDFLHVEVLSAYAQLIYFADSLFLNLLSWIFQPWLFFVVFFFGLVALMVTVVTESGVEYFSKSNLNSFFLRYTWETTGTCVYTATKQTVL